MHTSVSVLATPSAISSAGTYAVTVISTLPTETGVTTPSSLTVAIFSSDDDHVILASGKGIVSGVSVYLSSLVSWSSSSVIHVFGSTITLVAGFLTITYTVAEFPSESVAVIIVFPFFTPVIFPFSSTVAISGSLDVQVKLPFCPLALISLESPKSSFILFGSKVIGLSASGNGFTSVESDLPSVPSFPINAFKLSKRFKIILWISLTSNISSYAYRFAAVLYTPVAFLL